MCQHHQHKDYKDFASEKKYRLADFFNMWWDDYCKSPTEFIKPEQYKAVNAMRVCRTEVLGVDYYVCEDCGEVSEVRHSCKNRFCPTCSWKDTVKWADNLKKKIFDIPHRHSVFTLPHSLNGLIKRNKKEMLNILGRISADIFKSWFKSKYNVKIGVVSVIHTYGEKKNAHYHIHMIVAWGGMHFDTGELIDFKGKEKEYINYNHLKKEFRRKYVNELDKLFKNKELNHKFSDKEFQLFKKKIHKHKWQIHLEDPMDTPAAVIRYIGRYSKRACLSEYKITNIEGEYLTFKYKDYKDRIDPKDKKSPAKEKELRLHFSKFFPLLLQHVPPPYFRLVRYYGAYARFDMIPQEYKATQDEQLSETIEKEYETSEDNPKFCISCTRPKTYVNTLFDIRKKKDRTEPFDIKKHSHKYYKKVIIEKQERNLKNVA
ncbi:MAG: transposase [Candidatus Cloacimonadota bacterium]|nr:transposase [Candidatus Cloacimonadota bacterium]